MSGLFKTKALLLGMLLAAPPVAAWMWRNSDFALRSNESQTFEETQAQITVQIPVEIVAAGSPSQIVYVEVPGDAASLLHRQRPAGK